MSMQNVDYRQVANEKPQILSRDDHTVPGSNQTHKRHRGLRGALDWYLEWALPGLGMFSEAYIVFSAGQIGVFQTTMYPTCFKTYRDCEEELVKHVAGYIQICGIIAGMLFWGIFGDFTGRKWGSRMVASIMLTGVILLTFSPYANTPHGYFTFFLVAQTWYGFGVGGEYPMASSSAAERAAMNPELRRYRGQQVVLVFSNQGLGNFINALVILVSMAIFGQTGDAKTLTFSGSRKVLILTYGIGGLVVLFMVLYRYIYLNESKLFTEVEKVERNFGRREHMKVGLRKHLVSAYYYWPRQLVASAAWIANDFAFYGNKLQQGLFITLLYPAANPFKKQQWTLLNNFIALLGYYLAAALVDRRWYGRVRMQNIGFLAMFVFYIIIYGQWHNMTDPNPVTGRAANQPATHAFQALYYLSSFFNQFGPNATTWLVAGEIFPTDIRTSYHGFAAAMGKVGAIIAGVWISYISDSRKVFLVSAIFGIGGAVVTTLWLPDTTTLDLEELDRLQRYALEGRFDEYHGEAMNPKHLSLWEKYVLRWGKKYNPELDRQQLEAEIKQATSDATRHELARLQESHATNVAQHSKV